jgi:hypothetical protein
VDGFDKVEPVERDFFSTRVDKKVAKFTKSAVGVRRGTGSSGRLLEVDAVPLVLWHGV